MVKLFIYILIQAQLFSALGLSNLEDITKRVDLNDSQNNVFVQGVGPLKKDLKKIGLKVSARSALVVDLASGSFLFEKESDRVLPIASLTKLMTAQVFLDTKPDWNEVLEIIPADVRNGGSSTFKIGEKVKVIDLFNVALVASDNNAAAALVRASGLTEKEFVRLMNDKAQSLGMTKTFFSEVSGLSRQNVSTAKEIYILAAQSFRLIEIDKALGQEEYPFIALTGREHVVKSTNKLLNSYLKLDVGKTGYTEEAGYCLVARAQNKEGRAVMAVVLHSQSREKSFQEVKSLIQWSFDNYLWP